MSTGEDSERKKCRAFGMGSFKPEEVRLPLSPLFPPIHEGGTLTSCRRNRRTRTGCQCVVGMLMPRAVSSMAN